MEVTSLVRSVRQGETAESVRTPGQGTTGTERDVLIATRVTLRSPLGLTPPSHVATTVPPQGKTTRGLIRTLGLRTLLLLLVLPVSGVGPDARPDTCLHVKTLQTTVGLAPTSRSQGPRRPASFQ